MVRWGASMVPRAPAPSLQIAFAAVCYWVPDGMHGADVAGKMVCDLLDAMERDDFLREYYLTQRGG